MLAATATGDFGSRGPVVDQEPRQSPGSGYRAGAARADDEPGRRRPGPFKVVFAVRSDGARLAANDRRPRLPCWHIGYTQGRRRGETDRARDGSLNGTAASATNTCYALIADPRCGISDYGNTCIRAGHGRSACAAGAAGSSGCQPPAAVRVSPAYDEPTRRGDARGARDCPRRSSDAAARHAGKCS
jgi:hypothetical protein